MTAQPGSADWQGERGEKWLGQLTGMEAMLAPVDAPLFAALGLDAAYRIAEIGCGGGGTASDLARFAPAGNVIHGFDISPALIEAAQKREPTVKFAVADMAKALPEQPYDRLFSRFGVMFFDEPQAAFSNLFRWLKPGGQFAFAVWGPPADNEWIVAVRDIVASLVDIPRPDPEAPGPFRYAQEQKLIKLLQAAGFGDLKVSDWRGKLPVGGKLAASDAAVFALSSFSSFGELLAKAGPEKVSEAQRLLTARLAGIETAGSVLLGARVHIVTGKRNG